MGTKGKSGGKSRGKGPGGDKKRRGGEGGKGKKGKGKHGICSLFEFDVYRRHLQYEGAGCANNVFDMISRSPELSIFGSLLEATGIVDIFACGGPFTVLAPVDDAFSNLDLSSVSQRDVQELLLSHIIPGVYLEADFQDGTIESLAASFVGVSTPPLSFNSANAVETDIIACNGVLFQTDALVTNPGMSLKATIQSTFLTEFSARRWVRCL